MGSKNQNLAIVSGWVGKLPDYVAHAKANHERYADRHGYDYLWFTENEIYVLMGEKPLSQQSIWWLKPFVLRRALDAGYSAVFWTDVDSLFVNQSISMEDLLASKESFVFTGDAWDLCSAGHLWFRNTSFSYRFIELWLEWKDRPLELLGTFHQNLDGTLGDQPALNILLHGGPAVSKKNARALFDGVNGHPTNKGKVHKFFRWTHSPTTLGGTKRAQRLIHPQFAGECKVVPQGRLNSYPFNLLPAIRGNKFSPIIHFPGGHKNKMKGYG